MADQGRGRPFGLNNERRVPKSEERGRGIRFDAAAIFPTDCSSE